MRFIQVFVSGILFFLFLTSGAQCQDLLNERIRMIDARKKSVYFQSGVFHNGPLQKNQTTLKGLRHSYVKSRDYERIVIDFTTPKPPRIYGHINSQKKLITMDLFNTDYQKNIKSLGNSKFVEAVHFYPIDKDSLSVELQFKKSVSADIFYLENPGRLVIDVKI